MEGGRDAVAHHARLALQPVAMLVHHGPPRTVLPVAWLRLCANSPAAPLAHPSRLPAYLPPEQVFREDGLLSYSDAAGYSLDWFEGAIARPDAVLTDIVRAASPASAQARPRAPLRPLRTVPAALPAAPCTTSQRLALQGASPPSP